MSYNEEQMREIFYQEMTEIFERIDSCILTLERTPGDVETIKNLFREVHSLKGSSGVFGLREIADLTHHAEDLLDRIRDGELNPGEEIFSALLSCFDRLKEMMSASKRNENLSAFNNADIIKLLCDFKENFSEDPQEKNAVARIEDMKPGECSFHVSITGADQFYLTGIEPTTLILNCRDISTGLFSIFTRVSRIPALEDIEPELCYLEFNFNFVSTSAIKTINEIFEFAIEVSSVKITPNSTPATAPTPQASQPAQAATNDTNDFVRLKKEKLDQLMNLVGELMTMKNLFVHLSNKLEDVLPENDMTKDFKEGSRNLTHLTARLQENVMNARMVPVGTVFTKYTRLIRDIAKKLNKKIDLIIEGDETELDKTVSEAIGDPVMHLIRNSIDHGIETPKVRKERGKSETGALLLKASYEGNNVKLIIRDDGNGIDLERVKNKAISLGIVTKEHAATLSNKDIIDFIFHSGFSTASEITDVSGRGVGMDVVRNNIRKLNGAIFVETKAGQGTEFKIILPLSLAVIEALLIGANEEIYALPQEAITEIVRVEKKDVVNLNHRPSIQLRGEVIPILRLNEVVTLKESRDENQTNPVIIVQIDNIKVGILVDTLYWREQIMIKPLGGFLTDVRLFTGACIMGNGSVVLVLEPKELYHALPQTQL
ncbi:MAG: chemotaxis protein CheA [Bdellovibrionota bacterium]